jgi:hypothetical protein
MTHLIDWLIANGCAVAVVAAAMCVVCKGAKL